MYSAKWGADNSSLHAGKYTVFGQIIDGLEVLDRMEKVPSGLRPIQIIINLVIIEYRLFLSCA